MHRLPIVPLATLLAIAALLGLPVAPVRSQPPPNIVPDSYRTVEETELLLRDHAAHSPELARLIDFGDSWERTQPDGPPGYDLLALRISSPRWPEPKPTIVVVGAMHANELATAELATRLIDILLAGYGHDADITWLLDEHTVVVAPILNPDGRALDLPTRKTTSLYGTMVCRGVDLNRNFPYAWGGPGSAADSCSSIFRGVAPASEPETQGFMALLRELFPGRTPLGDAPFPDDTSGVVVSLHAAGELILYPWAHVPDGAPNGPGLARLAERLADRSGYRPIPAYELYPHSGRLDDWAYAELGLAALTFELGRSQRPSFELVDAQLWPENRGALLHAIRLSAAPYVLPAGPELEQIAVVSTTAGLELRATAVDPVTPAAVEVYVDLPPWRGGSPALMTPDDGALDSPREELSLRLGPELLGPGDGRRLLLLRGLGAGARPGPLWGIWAEPGSGDWVRHRLWLPAVRS